MNATDSPLWPVSKCVRTCINAVHKSSSHLQSERRKGSVKYAYHSFCWSLEQHCAELQNLSRRLTTTFHAVTNELECVPVIGRDVIKLKEKTSREEAEHGNYQQCRRLVVL